MYIPSSFAVQDADELVRFVAEHPFGLLVSGDGGLQGTHLPFEWQERGKTLAFHMAAGNPQAQLADGTAVLAVFSGPHAYISPRWYDHVNVPTWNYQAVHVRGRIFAVPPEALWAHMLHLTDRYEARAVTEQVGPTARAALLRGLRGFVLRVDKLEGAYKLSQNRNEGDYANIIAQLEASGQPNNRAVAQEMRKIKENAR